MKVGDFVKGLPGSDYCITNEKMTRGIITEIDGGNIWVKVLDHKNGNTGKYLVDARHFEVIGHAKPFDREEVIQLLLNGCKKAILDYDLRRADLRRADLRHANLSGADLSGANLSGANLSGANLRRANLSDADLSGANLSGANLRRADLRRADLRHANLSGADLSGANLSGANLSGANLYDANLSDADLSGANLYDANLSGADLSGANLDFSCWPLWCGSLNIKTSVRHAYQLAYHLCSMQCDDEDYIKMRNSILPFANEFHRVDECGKLKPIKEKL